MSKQPILSRGDDAPFTLKDIRDAIPKHLFKRSYFTSLFLLVRDLVEVGLAIGTILLLDGLMREWQGIVGQLVRYLAWTVYIAYQGVTMTGLWVLAHEMGHGAFSESQLLNDVIGYPLHTVMFVPYFAWAKSHAIHHAKTNNLDQDQVWVPDVKVQVSDPIPEPKGFLQTGFDLIMMAVIGWPLYITINATGPKTEGFVSHFYPGSEIYRGFAAWKIWSGTVGQLAWIYTLYKMCQAWGMVMVPLYFAPLIVVFFFLTAITYLQHTDERVPHYDDTEWNWLRGALCSVDRSMGSFLDRKLHYIHSHHVCHHIFSTLPAYNAPQATEYIKKVIGEYYMEAHNNWFYDLYDNYSKCLAMYPAVDKQTNDKIWWWHLEDSKKNQ